MSYFSNMIAKSINFNCYFNLKKKRNNTTINRYINIVLFSQPNLSFDSLDTSNRNMLALCVDTNI